MIPLAKRTPRRYLFVDQRVQGALVTRVVLYWIACMAAIAFMLVCWRILIRPEQPLWEHFRDLWRLYGPPALAASIVLPLVVVDAIRLSNRFAGPMARLRRELHQLAAGEKVAPLEFRQNDFWQDLSADFNAVAARLRYTSRHAPLDDASTRNRRKRPADLRQCGIDAEIVAFRSAKRRGTAFQLPGLPFRGAEGDYCGP